MTKKLTVNIIGIGRLGLQLALALKDKVILIIKLAYSHRKTKN